MKISTIHVIYFLQTLIKKLYKFKSFSYLSNILKTIFSRIPYELFVNKLNEYAFVCSPRHVYMYLKSVYKKIKHLFDNINSGPECLMQCKL